MPGKNRYLLHFARSEVYVCKVGTLYSEVEEPTLDIYLLAKPDHASTWSDINFPFPWELRDERLFEFVPILYRTPLLFANPIGPLPDSSIATQLYTLAIS